MRYKFIFFVVLCLFLLWGIWYVLFVPKPRMERVSPGGNYVARVYIKSSFFAMPGQGGIGSSSVKVVVFNKKGKKVGESTDDCDAFLDDVDIKWDLQNSLLWFAPARAINLQTGDCLY